MSERSGLNQRDDGTSDCSGEAIRQDHSVDPASWEPKFEAEDIRKQFWAKTRVLGRLEMRC